MDAWIGLLRFVHILNAVFMAWPLYALIAVNERGGLGPPLGDRADRYMENIIRGMTVRCFVFQVTALVTGVILVLQRGLGWGALVSNPVLLGKLVLLFTLMGLLSSVHFSVQPRLDRLFESAPSGPISGELATRITALRLQRKRTAAVCLFLVITLILLALQVYARLSLTLTILLLIAAAVFVWNAFRTRIPYGWI